MSLWGVLWRSENRRDGRTEHLVYVSCVPMLFRTRREARAYIGLHYSYYAHRPDLINEPHGWRMPIPVRVRVERVE